MDDAKYDIRPGDLTIETMPRHIKNVAAMFPNVHITLPAKDALVLARIIEQGLSPVVVEVAPQPSVWQNPLVRGAVVALCIVLVFANGWSQ